MNYCFNCGAKLIEKDQKFCIKCGTKLVEHEDKYKDYLKESHSKYNQREGESYNDYLKRINSPLNDKIATVEEIEHKEEDYINYDPLKTYKENNPQINYPKSEREDDTISDAEEKNRKEVIIEEMFGKPSVPIEGNYIVEGMYGRPKYYIDGDLIRQNNQFGKVVCRKKGSFNWKSGRQNEKIMNFKYHSSSEALFLSSPIRVENMDYAI
ncbi:zinc ribbon domain-containing protein [Methanobrevibacter ruminantium]|uniref:zinc ribbon domain-containing protein n=1 Tax=Methanobrevibacter ruminantium TaxID=83816 RepID=UPI003F08984F